MLTLLDLKLMAIEVQCINCRLEPASTTYRKLLKQVISRAPKIRFWL